MERLRIRYSPALDGLRAFAVLYVFANHSGTPLATGGFLGVDVFFVLSGFLITALLLEELDERRSISLKNFYVRRALRLLPALFLFLAVYTAATLALGSAEAVQRLPTADAATLFYFADFAAARNVPLGGLIQNWSLSLEEQFYLLWPILLALLLRKGVARERIGAGLLVAIALVGAARAIASVAGAPPRVTYFSPFFHADGLLVGCVIAIFAERLGRVSDALGDAGAFAALGGLVVLAAVLHITDAALFRGGLTLIAVLSGVMLLRAFRRPDSRFAALFSARPFPWIGRISYAVYLWNLSLVQFLSLDRLHLKWIEAQPVRLAALFAITTASWFLLERPALRLKSRFGRAKQSGDPAALAAS